MRELIRAAYVEPRLVRADVEPVAVDGQLQDTQEQLVRQRLQRSERSLASVSAYACARSERRERVRSGRWGVRLAGNVRLHRRRTKVASNSVAMLVNDTTIKGTREREILGRAVSGHACRLIGQPPVAWGAESQHAELS